YVFSFLPCGYLTYSFQRLDAALIRPGRVDVIHRLGLASQQQISVLFKNFYPEASTEEANLFASKIPDDTLSMAHLQGYLLLNKNNKNAALNNIESWQNSQKSLSLNKK